MEKRKQSQWVLVLIGVGKILKALALLAIAVEAHRLLHRDVQLTVENWVRAIRIDPDNVHLHNVIHRITGVKHRQLQAISLGSFVYAALFLTEGTGLVLRKTWAEYLTVVSTSLLLPMEVYEIFHGHHHRAAKLILFAVNVAIVVYLVVRLKRAVIADEYQAPQLGAAKETPA